MPPNEEKDPKEPKAPATTAEDNLPPLSDDPEESKLGIRITEDGSRMMPSKAFTKLREKAKKQGESAAMQNIAHTMGYKTVEAMQKDLAAGKLKAVEVAPPPKEEDDDEDDAPPPKKPSSSAPENGKEREKYLKALGKEQAKAQLERETHEKEVLSARERAEKAEARTNLTLEAVRLGIKHPKIAVSLMEEHIATLSKDELEDFEPEDYFKGLRKTEPALFVASEVPLSTGPKDTGKETPAPTTKEVTKASAPPAFNARKASKAEVDARWDALLKKK